MMEKILKWLLVGNCIGLMIGGFQQSYGVVQNESIEGQVQGEQQQNKESRLLNLYPDFFHSMMDRSPPFENICKEYKIHSSEMNKINKGIFTYKELLIGNILWNKFEEAKDSTDILNDEKLKILTLAADYGNETAVGRLLIAYCWGLYALQKDQPASLELARRYADEGSENAIAYLLNAHLFGWYGLQGNNPAGLELARTYASAGSEIAVAHLIDAHCLEWYGLQKNDSEVFVLAKEYAAKNIKIANYFLSSHGSQKSDWLSCKCQSFWMVWTSEK